MNATPLITILAGYVFPTGRSFGGDSEPFAAYPGVGFEWIKYGFYTLPGRFPEYLTCTTTG